MIEPPKFAVFLLVITAHMAVLVFGLSHFNSSPEAGSVSAPANAVPNGYTKASAVNDKPSIHRASPTQISQATGVANRYGLENEHDHTDVRANDESLHSLPAPSGDRDDADHSDQVDTVPTLEEHRRQHGLDDDGELPNLIDLERVAKYHEQLEPPATIFADLSKTPKLQPLPRPDSADDGKSSLPPALNPAPVDSRRTPVQMIASEKPKPVSPKLKPVVSPAAKSGAVSSAPKARPVPNVTKPLAPSSSSRAGSGRMKNLRPIK